METKKHQKKHEIFNCKSCDFSTSHSGLWKRHINTKKHNGNIGVKMETKKTQENTCYICGKIYKSRSGLYKHRTICSEKKELEDLRKLKEIKNEKITLSNTDTTFMNTYMNTIINMMKKIDEKDKLFEKQQQQINEMIPRLGNNNNNNNNNKININVFLNKNCKDAINMSEFLDGIKLQIKDFEYIKSNNLQDSIIKVFINNLHQMESCKRPIHCTDVKRETLYIKENNDWSKDKPREKLKKGFLNVVAKYRKKLNEWEELHPNWEDNEQMQDEYISLVRKTHTHTYKYEKTENKLIKNIAKETFIYN